MHIIRITSILGPWLRLDLGVSFLTFAMEKQVEEVKVAFLTILVEDKAESLMVWIGR